MKKLSILLFMSILAISFGCARGQTDDYAMVSFIMGEVSRNNAPLQIGDILKEKDIIQTGDESFCDIKIGGSLIRIKQKTKLVFTALVHNEKGENTSMDLDSGKMLCKPKKLLKSESFMVKTPTAVAGVRGTQFTVEADANSTTRIKVFDGSVKVAKRVKSLEESMNKILEIAPDLQKDQKVVVTKDDVAKAEKKVDDIMKKDPDAKDRAIDEVIKKAGDDVVVGKDEMKKFSVEDFNKDNKEIIDVRDRPVEDVKKLARYIRHEKREPRPNGRLLVTRFDVYYIRNGRVEWEGKVVEPPVKGMNRIYIAASGYVYCASQDGPVIWRKRMENDGRLEIRGNRLVVFVNGQAKVLNLTTGDRM